jgi:Xylanase inhibitor N-terminal
MYKLIPFLFSFFFLSSSLESQQFTLLTLTSQSTHQSQVTNKSNFSLPIYHLSSISNHTNNTFTFNDRINRDSARAALLAHNLSLPLERYKITDFGSDVVSGLSQGSGEYFIRVGVGTPAKEQYLVIDSGSDVIWLQCIPCTQCYAQSDSIFDPSNSASFTAVTCGSRVCHLVTGTSCDDSDESCRYICIAILS